MGSFEVAREASGAATSSVLALGGGPGEGGDSVIWRAKRVEEGSGVVWHVAVKAEVTPATVAWATRATPED